jgi:hypothetical protein
MAEKKSIEEEMQPIQIRSYNNAFEIQLFGESAKSFLLDWISLALIAELLQLALGFVYPFDLFFQYLRDQNWYIVQYVLLPFGSAFLVVKLTKRDGVSFWRWVVVLIEDLVMSSKFSPYYELPWYKSFWLKLRRKEE